MTHPVCGPRPKPRRTMRPWSGGESTTAWPTSPPPGIVSLPAAGVARLAPGLLQRACAAGWDAPGGWRDAPGRSPQPPDLAAPGRPPQPPDLAAPRRSPDLPGTEAAPTG